MGAVVGTGPLAAPSLQGTESAVPESGAALELPGDAPDLHVGFPQPSPAHGSGEGHWDLGMQRQALVLISGFSDPFAGGSSSLSVEPNVT